MGNDLAVSVGKNVVGDGLQAEGGEQGGFEHELVAHDGLGEGVAARRALTLAAAGIEADGEQTETALAAAGKAVELALLLLTLVVPRGEGADNGVAAGEAAAADGLSADGGGAEVGQLLTHGGGFLHGEEGLELGDGEVVGLCLAEDVEQTGALGDVGLGLLNEI